MLHYEEAVSVLSCIFSNLQRLTNDKNFTLFPLFNIKINIMPLKGIFSLVNSLYLWKLKFSILVVNHNIFSDSESPETFLDVQKAPPERRLSAELKRVQSLKHPRKPTLQTTQSNLITKSFDAESLQAILGGEGEPDGNS